MKRDLVLSTANDLVSTEREAQYGSPHVQLALAGELYTWYKQHAGTKYSIAHDVAIFDICQKLSRIACGDFKPDNYIDIAGYSSLACEVESNATLRTVSTEG